MIISDGVSAGRSPLLPLEEAAALRRSDDHIGWTGDMEVGARADPASRRVAERPDASRPLTRPQ